MKKDIIIPAAGESVTEADIVGWHKENGEFVNMDEPIVELETDKASMDLTAESAGVLTINVEDGTVQVGDIIGFITEGQGEKPTPAEPTTENTPEPVKVEKTEPESTNTYAAGHPSPAASKILDEKNITTNNVAGTGKDGRITKEDALKATPVQKEEPKKEPSTEPALPTKSGDRTIRREKMSRLRKTLMHRLVDAQQSTASLTTFNEIDMYEVMQIRKKYKESFKEKHGVGLGFMSFFTKAVTTALLNFPLINATIDGEEIVYHDYCDIGIAVATPKGLVVPVIKDAEQLNFHQIESSIRNFALKGRDGKITLADMEGGTFTITNGGTFGSMLSTPILNRPQSAILGMHNIVERPWVVNGEVKVRPIMYVALTYDHRLIDGSDAVQFLVNIKNLLEDPTRLMIGV
tara:strand:- start:5938 stop:7155 length:1218 start_codon:yes stop_codon:yes gene_type:complete